MKRRPVWLDIDFDFFVREKAQLGFDHTEAMHPMVQQMIWLSRAGAFAARNMNLADEMRSAVDVDPAAFVASLRQAGWRFSDDCEVVVSDSHASIGVQVIAQTIGLDERPEVVHIDAHHDLGYVSMRDLVARRRQGQCEAGDWLWHAGRGILGHRRGPIDSVRVVYPNWRKQDPESEVQAPILKSLSDAGCPVTFEFAEGGIRAPEGEVIGISIAQSSAWTPPWMDLEVARFVDSFDMPVLPVRGGLVRREWDKEAVRQMAEGLAVTMKLPMSALLDRGLGLHP